MTDTQIFIASNTHKWSWFDGSGVYIARAVCESRTRYKKDPVVHFWHYPWNGDRYGNPVQLVTEPHTSDLSALMRIVPVMDVDLQAAMEHFGVDRPIVGGAPPHLACSTRSNNLSWHHMIDGTLYVVHLTRKRGIGSFGISAKPADLSKRWYTVHQESATDYRNLFDDYTFACFNVEAYVMATVL